MTFPQINFNSGMNAPDLKYAADMLSNHKESDQKRGEGIYKWLQNQAPSEEDFRTYASLYLTTKNDIRKKLCGADLSKNAPTLPGILTREAERVLEVLYHLNAQKIQKISQSLKCVGGSILKYYKQLKLKNSYLDYDDLIEKTVSLLSKTDVAPWVLYKLDGGLDHILVDEAQDTSPSQWRVISSLAEEFFHNTNAEKERTLFVVGDTKQSIYSFQGAEPGSFADMRRRFQDFSRSLKRPWTVVDLDTSFRSSDAVLKVVDYVFSNPDLKESLLHEGMDLKHHAFREGHAGLVELWPLVKQEETSKSEIWEMPTQGYEVVQDPETQTAEEIATRIGEMLNSEEVLKPKGRPIKASDILILVQRRGSFVPKLIRCLKQKNIPVAGSDRMILNEQLVVKDLVALGEFLLLPEDDLTLACVLKSPLFNLSDEELIELCPNRKTNLWSTLLSSEKYKSVAEDLKYFLNLQDAIRPYELYEEVLTNKEGKSKFLSRLGMECLDPMEEFLNQILSFEQSNTPTLQGFIQYMKTTSIEVKRDFEQGVRDEVRVMTVHGSKGLQAPIVILPDTIRTPNNKPDRFLKTEEDFLWSPPQASETPFARDLKSKARAKRMEEYWRLLYVAMTRAEDRLYVCGWEGKKSSDPLNWYSVVEKCLQEVGGFDEEKEVWRYETDQNIEVPFEGKTSQKEDITPSPHWLRENVQPEDDPFVWVNPSTAEAESGEIHESSDRSSDYAAHRGTLIHKLLEILPQYEGNKEEFLDSFLNQLIHNLSQDNVEELKSHVLKILQSETFKSISGSNSWVEVPVVGKLDGQYISGQIDRLVEGENHILIVDYKTNQHVPSILAEVPKAYLKQMEIYAQLLAPLYSGKTIETALFWTETCELMKLDSEVEKAA